MSGSGAALIWQVQVAGGLPDGLLFIRLEPEGEGVVPRALVLGDEMTGWEGGWVSRVGVACYCGPCRLVVARGTIRGRLRPIEDKIFFSYNH